MQLTKSLALMASAGAFLFSSCANANLNATTAVESGIWPWGSSSPGAKLYCGPHYVDASHAREYAFQDLIRRCKENKGRKIKKTIALEGKHATTVAYFCNLARKGSKCDVTELKNALGYIQNSCKNNQGGHVLQVGEVVLENYKRAYGFTNDLDSIAPCGKKGDHWGLGTDVNIQETPKKTSAKPSKKQDYDDDEEDTDDE